jgi:hypothetical protein
MQRLRHRETIRVILDFNFPAQEPFQIRTDWLMVQANRIRVFQQTRAPRDRARRANANSMRRVLNVIRPLDVKISDAIENVGVTALLLRAHALPEKFDAAFIENNPLDFRAAKVDANPVVAIHFLMKKIRTPKWKSITESPKETGHSTGLDIVDLASLSFGSSG